MQFVTAESPCGMYSDTFIVKYKSCVIDTPELSVPSAFTPNADANNDYFTIFGSKLSSYHISIYNRWGLLVYESSNPAELNHLNAGWDGMYQRTATGRRRVYLSYTVHE
jgi:gliding motility-associated-like protein